MKEKVREYSSTAVFFSGMLTITMGYLTWCLFTISYRTLLFKGLAFFFTILTMGLYIGMVILSGIYIGQQTVAKQLMHIALLGGVTFGILSISNCRALLLQKKYMEITIEILWIVVQLGGYLYLRSRFSAIARKNKSLKWWFERKWLFILLIITLCLIYDPDATQFKWDGLLYYRTCNDLNVGSISSLAIYGHIAQTYGMLNGIVNRVLKDTAAAMMFVNCSMTMISICAFYGVIKIVIQGRKDWMYAGFAAMYAWSPFVLGMMHYHNLDYLCQCLFPLVLLFLYKEEWVYFVLASLMFCFTKEPAIIVYGAMCAGIVLSDWIKASGDAFSIRVKKMVVQKKYYLMILPAVLWLSTYIMLGPWSAGEGGFVVEWEYIAEKLKVLYVLNFNWIYSVIVVLGIIYLIYCRMWSKLLLILPVLSSQAAFTCFNCLFRTVNHPRYVDTNQVALYIMAVVLICCCNVRAGQIFSYVMAILLLISSFCTIDPITKICFPIYNIGSTQMVATMEEGIPLGDGMIYNRQMLGLERVINMALADAFETGDAVLFPTVENNAYFFDGMAKVGTIESGYYAEQEYWDSQKKKRSPLLTDKTETFWAYQLTEQVDFGELEKEISGEINYIYLPFVGERYAEEIIQRYNVLSEQEYEYRGWILRRICFKFG